MGERKNSKAYKLIRVGMYRENPCCRYCNKLMSLGGNVAHSATIEHVVPLSEGGKDAPSNMLLVHKGCNNIENWLHQMEKQLKKHEK